MSLECCEFIFSQNFHCLFCSLEKVVHKECLDRLAIAQKSQHFLNVFLTFLKLVRII